MTIDDLERMLCFAIFSAAWGTSEVDPMHCHFDQREMLQLQNEYLERWPR